MSKSVAHFSPGRVILLFTFITIIVGTALLALPLARKEPIPLLDLFFTATSSTCVTGIFTVPLDQFTTFGHCVILGLIQIGGIGLITLMLFMIYLLFDLGFGVQLLAGQIFEIESWKEIKRILILIVCLTLGAELLGTIATFLCIHHDFTFKHALFLSLFHAVSSFCNAGISLFGQSFSIATRYGFLITTGILMFMGSFGFLTWLELFRRGFIRNGHKRYGFSLITKIVLWSTLLLIVLPTALLLILEDTGAFAHLTTLGKVINAFYNAISLRSTGYLSVPIHSMQLASLLIIMVVAFIGAAPGSTGSGIKVVTFTVILAIIRAAVTGQSVVNIMGRRIAKDQLLKAVTIASLGIFWIVGTTFFLAITQPGASFFDIIFEATSAFTNLGITTGLNHILTASSKLFIIISMIIGRIGSFTLILALMKQRSDRTDNISFPEERVMLS